MFKPHVPSVARGWGRVEVAPGVEIAYTERGSGPPVVLVLASTMSARCSSTQLAGLAPSFRVIR
jgi:hypothetical protein